LDRVFLDANVLFSAAYASGAGLQRLWKLSEIELVTSHYAVAEARLMRAVSLVVEPDDISLPNDIELPAKDQPILASAIAAKSTHLLTGDVKHFGRYYRQLIAGVLILAPAEYLESRAADSS
jgi:predicted nucleic acid-binding protein